MKDFFKKIFNGIKKFFIKIKDFFVRIFKNKKSRKVVICLLVSFLSVSLLFSLFPLKDTKSSGKSSDSSLLDEPVTYVDMYQNLFNKDLSVGFTFGVPKTTSSAVSFTIADFDNYPDNNKKTIQLLTSSVVRNMPFSVPQLLYYSKDGLSAGTYRFQLDDACYDGSTFYDGYYIFTLTKSIPAGGGFRHTGIGYYCETYNFYDVLGQKLETYNPVSSKGLGGELLETVSVSQYTNQSYKKDLGCFSAFSGDDCHNSTIRNAYGSNRWKTSVIRQYLNSSASSNFWTPQTVFDRRPSCSSISGFLYGFDQEFINSLAYTDVKTEISTYDYVDGATFDITSDRFYLLSHTERYGFARINCIPEGEFLEIFSVDGDFLAHNCYLRTCMPNIPSVCEIFMLNNEPYFDMSYAENYTVLPCCSIIKK